jgi:integrase/recombinase XerD
LYSGEDVVKLQVQETSLNLLFGGAQVTIGQAVDAFLRAEKVEWSKQTETWYRRRLTALAEALGSERLLAEIQEVDLIEWRVRLSERLQAYGVGSTRPAVDKRLSPSTQRGHVRACKRFFRWLNKKAILPLDLAADLNLPKLPRQGKKGISEMNVRAILEAARDNPRDYALLRFMESTGARRAGVASLLLSDLNLDIQDLRLRRRVMVCEKGDKSRLVIMTPRALAALEAWLAERPKVQDEHVFLGREPGEEWHPLTPDGISAILQRYKIRLGIVGPVSPHQWRHRFCRKRVQEGLDLGRVSQLAGHEDPTITIKFYGGFNMDDLQDAYDQHVEDLDVDI